MPNIPTVIKFFAPVIDTTINALMNAIDQKMKAGQNIGLEEKQLEERLKGLRIDLQNIAKVIAANTGKSQDEVVQAMLDRTTLNPEEAKSWGLVHEKSSCFHLGLK